MLVLSLGDLRRSGKPRSRPSAEDFAATAHSPQVACLTGVRQSDAVVLVLGERYGAVQASGLSATHEEFREARESKPTLVFVQGGITPEPKQGEFIIEARDWAGGRIAPTFGDAPALTAAVIRGLDELELSRAAGTADPAEMSERARGLVPRANAVSEASLVLAIACGPRQPVLRPARLDDPQLARDLMQAALFGDAALLDAAEGTLPKVRDGALFIEQSRARIGIDPEGSILVVRPTHRDRGWDGGMTAVIEEDVAQDLLVALRFADEVLARIDRTSRLTHVAPVAALLRGSYAAWRTRSEHVASPRSMTMNMTGRDDAIAVLAPPARPRPALRHQAPELAEDLTTLLRRASTER